MDAVQLRHPVAEAPGENSHPRRMRPKSASYVALRSAVYQLTSMADFKLEKIGSGFFADVYKVRHKTTGEVMVLKMNKNSKTSKAMLSEIQLMNRLSHPNILRFKGSCVHEGHLHALTEYINGGSLEELLLDKEVKLSWSVRLKIIKDIVNGMVYLHSKNVFHRDLNPKNCLIQREKDGKLRTIVADFGLAAKIKQRRRRSHTEAVGSPYWMAPELLKGKSYCEQADVFSFGITLAEIMARIPADPDIMPRTMKYGLDSKALKEMCRDCPDQLMELLEKCCQIDPDDRPTFEEISDFLSTVQLPEEEEEEGEGAVGNTTVTGLPPLSTPILDSSSSHHDRDLRACISEPSILLSDLEDDSRSCGSEGEERLIVEQRHPLHRQRLLSSLGSSTGSSCGSIPETGIPEEGKEGVVMGGVHHLEITPGENSNGDSEDVMNDQTPKQLENNVGVVSLEKSSNEPIKVMLKFEEGSPPSPKSKCLFRRTSMEGLASSNGRKHSLQKSNSLNVDGRSHASNHTHHTQENGLLHPLCATSPSGNGLSSSVQTLLAEEDGVLCSDLTKNGGDGAGLGGGDSGIDPGDVDVFKFPSPPVGQVSPAPPTQGDHTPLCVSPAPNSPITAIPANGYAATPTLTPSSSTPNQHSNHSTYTPQATPSTANAHSPAHSGFSYSCTSSEDMTDLDGYGYSTPNNRCFSPTAQSWASSDYSLSLPTPSTPWAPPSSPMPPPPTCHTPHSLPTSPTHFYQHHQQPRPTTSTSKSTGRKNQHHRQSLEVTGTHYPSPSHSSNITSCMRKSGSRSCRNSALFPELHDENYRGSGGDLRGQGRQGSYEDDEIHQRKSVHFEDMYEERLFGDEGATDYSTLLSATKSSLTSPNRPRSKSSPRRLRKISAYSPQNMEDGALQGGEYGIGLELDTTDPHSCKFYKIAQKSNMRLSNSAPDLSKLLIRLPPPVL